MASILKVDALQGIASADNITVTVGTGITQSLHEGIAKAYWFLQHDSVPAMEDIKSSLNMSSITDENTGEVSYTFTNNFSNVYHLTSVTGTAEGTGGGGASSNLDFGSVAATSQPRTNGSRVRFVNGTGGNTDVGDAYSCLNFGDLA